MFTLKVTDNVNMKEHPVDPDILSKYSTFFESMFAGRFDIESCVEVENIDIFIDLINLCHGIENKFKYWGNPESVKILIGYHKCINRFDIDIEKIEDEYNINSQLLISTQEILQDSYLNPIIEELEYYYPLITISDINTYCSKEDLQRLIDNNIEKLLTYNNIEDIPYVISIVREFGSHINMLYDYIRKNSKAFEEYNNRKLLYNYNFFRNSLPFSHFVKMNLSKQTDKFNISETINDLMREIRSKIDILPPYYKIKIMDGGDRDIKKILPYDNITIKYDTVDKIKYYSQKLIETNWYDNFVIVRALEH